MNRRHALRHGALISAGLTAATTASGAPAALLERRAATAFGASPQAASPAASDAPGLAPAMVMQEYPLPRNSRPHDVACALDGGVWFTAQGSGHLGWLDPASGQVHLTALGNRSAPHGVIVGPDGAPWITDGGQNAIVRVDPGSGEVIAFPLPSSRGYTNLNTASFDATGALWFTGQAGVYGRLDPTTGEVQVFDAPRGPGPYGITTTPGGDVFYVSLAGSHLARINLAGGLAEVIEPPTPRQGARRVWTDSLSRVWISEWNSGQLSRFDPSRTGREAWGVWKLPGARPMTYAVYVDDLDHVWVTDFGGNALHRFDPVAETFDTFPHPRPNAQVRQLLGRPGEVWGALSAQDGLVVLRRQ